jgi:hypothetical protein
MRTRRSDRLVLLSLPASAQIYKWTDAQGRRISRTLHRRKE